MPSSETKPDQQHVLVTFGRAVTKEDLDALQSVSADASIDEIDMDISSGGSDIHVHTLQ